MNAKHKAPGQSNLSPRRHCRYCINVTNCDACVTTRLGTIKCRCPSSVAVAAVVSRSLHPTAGCVATPPGIYLVTAGPGGRGYADGS